MPLGIYLSVPFCRTKCSYCNFASDVFSKAVFQKYIDRVCHDLDHAAEISEQLGGQIERAADSVYLGGGTPTVLGHLELEKLFAAVRRTFEVAPNAEVTVECAPGTLSSEMLEMFQKCGVNRVSLGAQSFVDREASSVGRLHKRDTVLDDVARLRAAGISEINVDLIAGLPHQTTDSWESSLSETVALEVPHASVYMLEVDEDSRLGRELIAGGTKYHAHFVPDEELTADLYERACERLEGAGIRQYEISNFARSGHESRHNLKYWTRQPYLGFGVDAHSMLNTLNGANVRFSTPDSLERYVAGGAPQCTLVSREQALEESFFLGLRLTQGVDLGALAQAVGAAQINPFDGPIREFVADGLMVRESDTVRLTSRGRLLSNEIFQHFLLPS